METRKDDWQRKHWCSRLILEFFFTSSFGSGRVKIARHLITRELAAVKIIPKRNPDHLRKTHPGTPDEDRLIRSTEREIVIMNLIDHPHILKLYDVWETSNHL